MAAIGNFSSPSLSPKAPKFMLTARESLVFQLLLSISAPFRSVTDYLGHRIWISSLTTSPSWQSRLMEFHPRQKSKLITTFNLTVKQLTWQTSTSYFTLQLCTLYHNHWNFKHQLSKWQFNVQLYPSTFMLTCQQWSWHLGCQRKMKFESPSRIMLSHQRRTNPAKFNLRIRLSSW